jgi:hypothetical protein
MIEETWKDIRGFEGKYQISSIGNVRSLNYRRTNKIKNLAFWISTKGYPGVRLGDRVVYRVSRLVAQEFISNPENLPCVLHRDDDVSNNKVSNLFWGTNKDNVDDKVSKGRQAKLKGELNGESKIKEKDVLEIRNRYLKGGTTHRELAKLFKVSKTQITRILNNKSWKHL